MRFVLYTLLVIYQVPALAQGVEGYRPEPVNQEAVLPASKLNPTEV
jgi:hypothetical protein